MPYPATPTSTGNDGASVAVVTMNEIARSANPIRVMVRRETRVEVRAWIQEPVDQVTVAAVSAKPAKVTEVPRTSTRPSGTKASTPKKARLSSPIVATVAGIPGAARSVPG